MRFDLKEFKKELKFYCMGGRFRFMLANCDNLAELLLVLIVGLFLQGLRFIFFPISILIIILIATKLDEEKNA